ncbi:MAG: hypothetical protein H0U67_15365, partial [Gemmatimonadetes bacterium]|nr:hypothetical protein [Gemmatimonadota bacterium]
MRNAGNHFTYPERADEDVYVERIPIAETRDCVKKVRFHGHVYRRLYGADQES